MKITNIICLVGLLSGVAVFAAKERMVLQAHTTPWLPHERAVSLRIWRQTKSFRPSYRLEFERVGEKTKTRFVPEAVYHYLRDSLFALSLSAEAAKVPVNSGCAAALVAELPEIQQITKVCVGDMRSYLTARSLLSEWVAPLK